MRSAHCAGCGPDKVRSELSLEFCVAIRVWTVLNVVQHDGPASRRSRYLQVNFPLDLEMLVQAKHAPSHVSHAITRWNIVWGRFTAASA